MSLCIIVCQSSRMNEYDYYLSLDCLCYEFISYKCINPTFIIAPLTSKKPLPHTVSHVKCLRPHTESLDICNDSSKGKCFDYTFLYIRSLKSSVKKCKNK